ncbi:MAG: GIY-YIG nuclease family protein [Acidobacteria bacterium]|nr:GIY-YIG nuclease family protein [Acidobacteriota bacterium]
MSDPDLDELAEELAEFAVSEKKGGRSPLEERIIAGFEDIQRFVEKHCRAPQHGEDRDIFERLYAVRLDRLRAQEECRALLAPVDHQALLGDAPTAATAADAIDDDELLAELADDAEATAADITALRHVRTSADKRAAEEIAHRKRCEDFETFEPLFERVRREIDAGDRLIVPVQDVDAVKAAAIQTGDFFIVEGQLAYVADMGEEFTTQYDRKDSRLRVIYDNGTENDVLQRSLQRALHRDPAARFVTSLEIGPLFADQPAEDDLTSGTIYVLRSKSDNPIVAANRHVLHKIGVTGGKIAARFANARLDPTFLLADVEIVATYELYNVNRVKLENVIHRVFGPAQLDIEIKDRFGNPVKPREWFLVPLAAVDEAVSRIKDGTITQYVYEPIVARLTVSKTVASS